MFCLTSYYLCHIEIYECMCDDFPIMFNKSGFVTGNSGSGGMQIPESV